MADQTRTPRPHRATLSEVAGEAGVSLTTASMVLNGREPERFTEATRQRVRDAARQLAYRPRGRNSAGAAGTAGAQAGRGSQVTREAARQPAPHQPVYLFMHPQAHVFGRLTADLSRLLQDQGFWSQPVVPQGRSARVDEFDAILDTWREQPPAGVVLQYPTPGLADRIDDTLPGHIRRIAVYRDDTATPAGWPRVNWSIDAGMKTIVRHLIALGHRRVGVVTNQRPARINPSLRKRTHGHTRQVLALGHTLREAGIHHGLTIHYNDNRHDVLDRAEIDRIADWLQQTNRPTAVVSSDFRLIAVRRAAEQLGLRIPEDLALVGIGNTPWAEALNVSSLAVREELAARHIARLITAEPWQFDGASQHIELEPRLVVRASCGGEAETAQSAALTDPALIPDADAPLDFDVFTGV